MYRCTAGRCSCEADHKHSLLGVALCGRCDKASKEAMLHNYQPILPRVGDALSSPSLSTPMAPIAYATHQTAERDNDLCIWCGNSDGTNLFMCDACPSVYCEICCLKNFGPIILQQIRDAEPWSCFLCLSTPYFEKIQLNENDILLNLDDVYAGIRPPDLATESQTNTFEQRALLSQSELRFASIFTDIATTRSLVHLCIHEYLNAMDMVIVYRISKRLRQLFTGYAHMPIPGLFRTPFGHENHCVLHPHQINSLLRMRALESCSTEFGVLRGGILGDEPGLGKTVTVLALILSSAGTLPRQQSVFWNSATLDAGWTALRCAQGQASRALLPMINEMERGLGLPYKSELVRELADKFFNSPSQLPTSVHMLERELKQVVHRHRAVSQTHRETAAETLRMSMNKFKSGLDKSERGRNASVQGRRILFERSIRPSAATLVVVPLALLEHWFEQIIRHVGLHYYTHAHPEEEAAFLDEVDALDLDPDARTARVKAFRLRGVVYLDGIGDAADVQTPLSKLMVTHALTVAPETLAHYLIVITTVERCAQQYANMSVRSSSKKSANFMSRDRSNDATEEFFAMTPLLQIRWLRLVVDEGHDLGHGERPSEATLFIAELAAERRWVMSGTPTSDASTRNGLKQLQRLMQFLRHEYGVGTTGAEAWKKGIYSGFVRHDVHAAESLVALLRGVMVRHQKSDIQLHSPVYTTVVLDQIQDLRDAGMIDERGRRFDRAIARYIMEQLAEANTAHKAYIRSSGRRSIGGGQSMGSPSGRSNIAPIEVRNAHRQPKFILFSEKHHKLQAVAHFLYLGLGDQGVCEHYGIFRSTELSRFRHSKRTFRVCPLCGHKNGAHAIGGCERTLLRIVYDALPPRVDASPCAGGHGAYGPGGHFTSTCLCNNGNTTVPHVGCCGYPNALFDRPFDEALIAEEHISSSERGHIYAVGQRIQVLHASPSTEAGVLWQGGRLGGWATILEWKRCGGKSPSWHGARLFQQLSWKVEDEAASVLLLCADGSHGLDLSFVTNIFLLERLKDKALEEQIDLSKSRQSSYALSMERNRMTTKSARKRVNLPETLQICPETCKSAGNTFRVRLVSRRKKQE